MAGTMSGNWLVLGICGVTCGGKTTLATELNKIFPNSVMISQDDYFLDVDDPRQVLIPELNHWNFELITSLDMERMHKDIVSVINEKRNHAISPKINVKERNFILTEDSHTKIQKLVSQKLENSGTRLLIVEGFSILNYKPIESLCNIKYYLTLNRSECAERRAKRVYEPPDCPGYFEKCVWPEYLKLLEDVQTNVQDVKFFDEYSTDIVKKVLIDIKQFLHL